VPQAHKQGSYSAQLLARTVFSQDNALVPTAQAGRSQPHVVTNNTALTNTYTHPLLNCTASSQANVFPTAQACANRMLQQVSNQHSSISHTDPCIHPCQQVDPSTHFTAHLLVKPNNVMPIAQAGPSQLHVVTTQLTYIHPLDCLPNIHNPTSKQAHSTHRAADSKRTGCNCNACIKQCMVSKR